MQTPVQVLLIHRREQQVFVRKRVLSTVSSKRNEGSLGRLHDAAPIERNIACTLAG